MPTALAIYKTVEKILKEGKTLTPLCISYNGTDTDPDHN